MIILASMTTTKFLQETGVRCPTELDSNYTKHRSQQELNDLKNLKFSQILFIKILARTLTTVLYQFTAAKASATSLS